MDRIGTYFDNLNNTLVHPGPGKSTLIRRVNGHYFVQWNSHVTRLLTDVQLRRLLRRFGQHSSDKLVRLLERSGIQELDTEKRKVLKRMEKT